MKKQIDQQVLTAGVGLSLLPFQIRRRFGRRGAVAVEYVLLITVVGIGALVGLASVRDALINELDDLAMAIMSIT